MDTWKRKATSLVLIALIFATSLQAVSVVKELSVGEGPFLEKRSLKEEFGTYVVNRTDKTKSYEDQPLEIRLGMKVLFGSWFILSPFIRFQLKVQSMKKGEFEDSPESAKNIPKFIKTYKLNLSELKYPNVSHYKTFNQFFYRELKPGARVIAEPDNPAVLVSPADCRMGAFTSVGMATEYWIKGKNFNLANLLKDEKLARDFDGGSLGIFRLAPQDYHRFHSPAGLTVERIVNIPGEYYTVNPLAVKENLDVFTDNKRSVIVANSPAFGKIAYIAIGALLVGSIQYTNVTKGRTLSKGDEVGYFAFGGSTIILVFQKNRVNWDQDLVNTSKDGLESLVKMGEHIGVSATSK